MPTNRIAALFSGFALLSLLLLPSAASLATTESLRPHKDQGATAKEIARKLEILHYNKQKFGDQISAQLWEQYIDDLDPTKSYFLASDIKEFRSWRTELDDDIKAGNVDRGFDIYNRYRLRAAEQVNNLLLQLDQELPDFDFKKDESLELDREDSAWPESVSAANDLWRKRLKSDVLNLR